MDPSQQDTVNKIIESNAEEEVLWSAYRDLKAGPPESLLAKKLLAEVSFLLARHYKRKRDYSKAEALAEESIGLYKQLNTNTLQEAAPILYPFLPDIMHEDVIREEFKRPAA